MAGNSARVNVLVEGQTEETFVREVIAPHLAGFQVWATARIVETSKGYKGGAVSFAKMEQQVRRWCLQDPTATITTMFDVYGLPNDFPGGAHWIANANPETQAAALETAFQTAVGQPNFLPYLQLHEFEALLFSDLNKFSYADVAPQAIAALHQQLAGFATPEHVNNSPQTAPSKRIIQLWPGYEKSKPLNGALIALAIGLPAMRQACLRFDAWISKLEGL